MSRKLYVGNLPYETGETELQELFSRAGTVETVRVMRDSATGRARGFAFVEMSTDEEAQNAITSLWPHGQRGASEAGEYGWVRRRRRFAPSQVRASLVACGWLRAEQMPCPRQLSHLRNELDATAHWASRLATFQISPQDTHRQSLPAVTAAVVLTSDEPDRGQITFSTGAAR
jgi:hypothetical protein